jgi:imidazole glycerol-phosphate synthase subunit HisH
MKAVLVDYDICNMFSVKQACERAGLEASVTSNLKEIQNADVVVLPGIGAFGDAMSALKRLDLVEPLKDIAASGKPLFGICLGLQLLMNESHEFGHHKGLGIIPGVVKKFDRPHEGAPQQSLKVPHVGWNKIHVPDQSANTGSSSKNAWEGSPLEGIDSGSFFYFVHSYYVEPASEEHVMCRTTYGNYDFCSGVRWNNVHAVQFHPERSGSVGMQIYKNIKAITSQQQIQQP